MSELTKEQMQVLRYVDCFGGANPGDIRVDLREAFLELEALGLIKQFTEYRLTDDGCRVITGAVSSPGKSND